MNVRPLLIAISLFLSTITLWYIHLKKTNTSTIHDTIIVGTNLEFPPFSFMQDNKIVGFDIDVVQEVVKRLGKKIILKQMAFDALIPEIQLGSIHMIASGISPTPERAQQVLFTQPLINRNPLVLISLTNNPITSIKDLSHKQVTVNEGYFADTYISSFPDISILRLSSAQVSDGILALKNGRGCAFIAAYNALKPFFDIHGTEGLVITTLEETDETDVFAISKKYPELLQSIEKVLDNMRSDGILEQIQKKWGLL